MITVKWSHPQIEGLRQEDAVNLSNFDPIRKADIASIRGFVENNKHILAAGRVLDFGAGRVGTCRNPQPFRDLVSKDAEYLPYDLGDIFPEPPFDTIMCTQVTQYVPDVALMLKDFYKWLAPTKGFLLLTYATNWDEVEATDLWRFTRSGMHDLLVDAGFIIGIHERRAEVCLGYFKFPLGYGVVAKVNV